MQPFQALFPSHSRPSLTLKDLLLIRRLFLYRQQVNNRRQTKTLLNSDLFNITETSGVIVFESHRFRFLDWLPVGGKAMGLAQTPFVCWFLPSHSTLSNVFEKPLFYVWLIGLTRYKNSPFKIHAVLNNFTCVLLTEVKLVTFMKVSHSYIVSNFVHSSIKTSRNTPENYPTVEFLLLHSDQYPARFFTVSIWLYKYL